MTSMSGAQHLYQSQLRFGLAALLLGNVALSFGVLFVRVADVGPVASAFWRMALALPILFALARRGAKPLSVPNMRTAWLFLWSGLFFAADLGAWHIGLLETKLANSNLLANAACFLFPLYGFVITRQFPSRMQGAGLLLATLGAGLLMGRSFELSPQYFRGDLLSLAAGVFYTFYLIVIDRVRRDMTPWSVLFWATLSCALPLLLFALWRGETVWPQNWWPLILLALCSQIIGQGLTTYVIGQLSSLVIGIALLIQPVIAAGIGYVLYNEKMGWLDLAGALLIAAALILVREREPAKAEGAPPERPRQSV
jgi:drug/metabolite transporter (DMT)-like permease